MGQITTTTYIEVCVEVEADYMPGDPGCRTLSNGDPGWPPEAAEVEVTSVKVKTPNEVATIDILSALTPEQIEYLEEQAVESLDEDGGY
jgi:hypothetical protein